MKKESRGYDKPRSKIINSTTLDRFINFRSTILVLVLFILGYFYLTDALGGKEVRFVPAVAFPSETADFNNSNFSTTKGDLIFQASGWIEPDPFPIRIPSLYSGVVKEVHILEGDKVFKNQTVVTMIEEDAELAIKQAKADLGKAKAEASAIMLEIELAEATKQSEVYALGKDFASMNESNDTLNRLRKLPDGAVSNLEITQARFKMDSRKSVYLQSKTEILEQEVRIRALLQKLKVQQEIISSFEIALDIAQLDLSRTKIKAPVDGVVLRLLASPGSRIMLNMDKPDASTAVILYEEGKLQARIDVPLSEAAKIYVGQLVSISSSLLPDQSFNGRVTRIVGEADLQRNTLQVKVSIEEPDLRLKPEMLCRAKFFGPFDSKKSEKAKDSLEVFVPQEIQDDNSKPKQKIWVLAADGKRAETREVIFGDRKREGFVSVLSGLNPGDQVIQDAPEDLEIGDLVIKLEEK